MKKINALNHPNIVKLMEVDRYVEYKYILYSMLVLELVERGELYDCFTYLDHFDDTLARTYFHQLLSALEACHSLDIYHLDVKPDNILIDCRFQLKLIDFGLSIRKKGTLSITPNGTPGFKAPEVSQGQLYHISYILLSKNKQKEQNKTQTIFSKTLFIIVIQMYM